MRLLDLFSGIGGFSLAAQWVWGDELEIVAFCEIDKFCQKVLKKHWPDVPIIEDVRDVTKNLIAYHEKQIDRGNIGKKSKGQIQEFGKRPLSRIDLLIGGFPCQPFSVAGKRKGKEDNRFLWPEMFAVIKEIRPRWVVAENVAGIVRMELDNCLSDLEGEGYSTQAVIIPACAVNAPHRRDRVWIVAHDRQQPARDESPRLNRQFIYGASEKFGTEKRNRSSNGSQDVADTEKQGRINGVRTGLSGRRMPRQTEVEGNGRGERRSPDGWWSTQSRLGGMVDGVPDWSHEPESVPRVAKGVKERVNRLKSLGNAIVPQVAEQIFRVIKEVEEHKENQWQPM